MKWNITWMPKINVMLPYASKNVFLNFLILLGWCWSRQFDPKPKWALYAEIRSTQGQHIMTRIVFHFKWSHKVCWLKHCKKKKTTKNSSIRIQERLLYLHQFSPPYLKCKVTEKVLRNYSIERKVITLCLYVCLFISIQYCTNAHSSLLLNAPIHHSACVIWVLVETPSFIIDPSVFPRAFPSQGFFFPEALGAVKTIIFLVNIEITNSLVFPKRLRDENVVMSAWSSMFSFFSMIIISTTIFKLSLIKQ